METKRIKEAKDSINNPDDKFKNFEEVLKSNNLLNIDAKINTLYISLLDNEKNDFLKWLELEILAEWKNRQYKNQNNKNINTPFFLNLAGKFNQTIEYVENWIKEKKSNIKTVAPQQSNTKNTDEVKQKKIAEKWHALLYWIELTANGQLLPIDNEGNFIKSEIEKIGKEKTGSKGQSFYKQFRLIDLNNSKELIGMFGNDWKEKIIHLSNNNQTIIDYIELKFKQ